MWGVTWHDGTAWGVSYGGHLKHSVNSLMTSKDGKKFDTYVKDFFAEKTGQPKHESALRAMEPQSVCSD